MTIEGAQRPHLHRDRHLDRQHRRRHGGLPRLRAGPRDRGARQARASPPPRTPPSAATARRYNPEEMLVASLSSCHMLWYLHLCSAEGIVVQAYQDIAEGVMMRRHRMAAGGSPRSCCSRRSRSRPGRTWRGRGRCMARPGQVLHRQLGQFPGPARAGVSSRPDHARAHHGRPGRHRRRTHPEGLGALRDHRARPSWRSTIRTGCAQIASAGAGARGGDGRGGAASVCRGAAGAAGQARRSPSAGRARPGQRAPRCSPASSGPCGWRNRARRAGVVTNPISKATLYRAGFPHPGHTEFLGALTGAPLPVMMLANEFLRVVPVTVHVSLRAALDQLDCRDHRGGRADHRGGAAGAVRHRAAPRLAVAGLNPHAGEEGALGDEEARIVQPAIEALRRGRDRGHRAAPARHDVHAGGARRRTMRRSACITTRR